VLATIWGTDRQYNGYRAPCQTKPDFGVYFSFRVKWGRAHRPASLGPGYRATPPKGGLNHRKSSDDQPDLSGVAL